MATGKIPLLDVSGRFPDRFAPVSVVVAQEAAVAAASLAQSYSGIATSAASAAQSSASAASAAVFATVGLAHLPGNEIFTGIKTFAAAPVLPPDSLFPTTILGFTEAVQDAVAGFLAAGTNVNVSYNDAANTLTVSASGAGGTGGLDEEAMRDAMGIALVGVGLVTITPNDLLDTITITTTATANRTDATTDGLLTAKAPLASPTFTGTVGGITKSMIGLANADNTTDVGKPVSTAQAAAIAVVNAKTGASADTDNSLTTGTDGRAFLSAGTFAEAGDFITTTTMQTALGGMKPIAIVTLWDDNPATDNPGFPWGSPNVIVFSLQPDPAA